MATAVNLLQLSPTMTEGTIVKWLVKEGDEVSSGTPIAEVETDKAVMEQESFDDGFVLKVVVPEGEKVAVESLIMVIGQKGEDISALLSSGAPAASAAPKKSGQTSSQAPATTEKNSGDDAPIARVREELNDLPPAAETSGRTHASPLARKIAEDAGVNLSAVKGSGPQGRVIKRDVEEAIASGSAKKGTARSAAAVATAADETIKLSGMRQTIARRLSESKQSIPHFQLTVEVRGEALVAGVAKIKETMPDAKVTVTHFLIKAMAATLMRHKALRSQWGGDSLKVINAAHISVAVAIEDGLVTPVIRNVHTKGVVAIAEELRELAGLARSRKLTAEDMSGGVQTISNLGMFGIHEFTAIVNPPEASILAVGAMEDRPVVDNGQVVPGKVMKITMSADHRVVDGAVGAQYLADLKRSLENPLLMLL